MATIATDIYKIIHRIIKSVYITIVNSNIVETYKITYFKDRELCITENIS
jgi:hypothetical protein